MRIIKEGEPSNQITCHKCDCIFEYEESDIYQKNSVNWENFYFVDCPCCGRCLIIDYKPIVGRYK